jgi:hypothetical protein
MRLLLVCVPVAIAGAMAAVVRFVKRGFVPLLVVAILAAAAIYEVAVALGWIPMGSQPGDEASGQGIVLTAAMLGILAGVVDCAAGLRARREPAWPAAFIPPAAAAYVTAQFYSFDSYNLPSLIRFSEEGSIPAGWIYGLVVCALVVALATRIRPRLGLGATAVLLLVCAGTVVGEGFGH